MSFFEKVLQADRQLFLLINNRWTNPVLDLILPFSRNAITWIPFYLFLLVFMLLNHKRKLLLWIALAVTTAAATDIISSRLIKENIFRLRPCHDLLLHVRFLAQYCPQSSSFTSSHAANHFGFSTFIYLTLNRFYGKWVSVIFLWAFLVSYAQVYVGVHYPLDVAGGAVVGMIIGYLTAKLYTVIEQRQVAN